MAGLLGDVLPYLYSRGNALTRHVKGLLSDPLASMEQTAGLLNDKYREHNALMDVAFADKSNPFQVTDRNALAQVSTNMLTGPLGFAPAGMTANAMPYWHDPNKAPKIDQFGAVRDASRSGSMEWAGTNTPERKAESLAQDMRRILAEDWHNKDFDPSGVRAALAEWAEKDGLNVGSVYRAFLREMNATKDMPPRARQMITEAWSK
jgi:hypothetical protein